MYFNIYIIFLSTAFLDKIFISTMPCGRLFMSPISQIYVFLYLKKLQVPQYSTVMLVPLITVPRATGYKESRPYSTLKV